MRGALGSIKKKKKTEKPLWLKITQNRKTAIDFDQNRKPHTKPSKPKIYAAQFSSQNPGLDLKRRWYVHMIILGANIYVIIVSALSMDAMVVKQTYLS